MTELVVVAQVLLLFFAVRRESAARVRSSAYPTCFDIDNGTFRTRR